jgi:hypothetical protein
MYYGFNPVLAGVLNLQHVQWRDLGIASVRSQPGLVTGLSIA